MTAVQDTERAVREARVLPVVVLGDSGHAAPLADALLAGGLHAVEVTFRTEAAEDSIRHLARRPDLLVGAGTVLTPAQVDRAVAAGARFVVSPGFGAAVVKRCQDLGVAVFPGVATATEIQMALDAGVDTVKFFPAEQLGGVGMIKALSAPFRSVRFIPTGGVNLDNLSRYLALPSVLAVGGTWMVAPDLVAAGDWARITRLTTAAVSAAGGAPGGAAAGGGGRAGGRGGDGGIGVRP